MQVIFGVLLFAFVMSTELYAMINYSKMYLVIAGLAVIDLVCLYVVINGLFALREMKDARNEEQYDSVFKSEKASYLMLKKYFEEIEDKLNKDVMLITCEAEGRVSFEKAKEHLHELFKSRIGVTPRITVVPVGTLPRSEKKAKRVIDHREL